MTLLNGTEKGTRWGLQRRRGAGLLAVWKAFLQKGGKGIADWELQNSTVSSFQEDFFLQPRPQLE